MRLVLDTNIIISALFWNGKPRRVLRDCWHGKHRLLVSFSILDELDRVLGKKFGVRPGTRGRIIWTILKMAELVHPVTKLGVIAANPQDDDVLETAISGKADAIVTGDKHLLTLKRFQGVAIRSAKEALNAQSWNEEE